MLIKKCQAIVLLAGISSSKIAVASNSMPCESSDWRCHNSFFVTGGYAFYHALYKNNTLLIIPPGKQEIDFTPLSAHPNNENAMRFGFGSNLGNYIPFSYEFNYTQGFSQSKTSLTLEFTKARKVLSGSITYALNPKSRLRFNLVGGASVTSIYLTTSTVAQQTPYSVTVNAVDVDPFLGGSISYSINSRFAVRLSEYFAFSKFNLNTNGTLATFLMLNYYPGAV